MDKPHVPARKDVEFKGLLRRNSYVRQCAVLLETPLFSSGYVAEGQGDICWRSSALAGIGDDPVAVRNDNNGTLLVFAGDDPKDHYIFWCL
jgi:hypothetical protein